MTVIRTKTPAGEPIVIMSEPEFERLRELAEDAEDIAIVARSRTALAAGAEELLTLDEVDALHAAPTRSPSGAKSARLQPNGWLTAPVLIPARSRDSNGEKASGTFISTGRSLRPSASGSKI